MEDKIEQYCLLAKGARGRALQDLVGKATAEPGLFHFGELMDVESIRELAGTELGPCHLLLQLFSFGMWKEYAGSPASYPPLDDMQKLKLRQLTAVSIANTTKVIPYGHLMEQLDIANVRELEDFLITECFYTQLLKGKLDQCQRCLHVHEALPRDVPKDQLEGMIGVLGDWLQTSESTLGELETKVQYMSQKTTESEAKKAELDAKIEEIQKSLKVDMDGRGPVGSMAASGSQDSMMVEDGSGTVGTMVDFMEQDRGSNRPKRRR